MSKKKIVSLTLPEALVERVDARVEEEGHKSRSAFVSGFLEQHLSGQTITLTDEEYQALLIYSEAVQMSPDEVVRFVLTKVVGVGEKVKERLESEV